MGTLICLQGVWLVRQLLYSQSTVRVFLSNSWNLVEVLALVVCALVVVLDSFAFWSGAEVRSSVHHCVGFSVFLGECLYREMGKRAKLCHGNGSASLVVAFVLSHFCLRLACSSRMLFPKRKSFSTFGVV